MVGPGGGYLSNTWWPATMSYQPTNAAAGARRLKMNSPQRRYLNLQQEGEAALRLTNRKRTAASATSSKGNFVISPPCPPSLTEVGVVIDSGGPMWCVRMLLCTCGVFEIFQWHEVMLAFELTRACVRSRHVGSNLEHANSLELSLEPGSTNHMFVGLQTEEAPIALYLNTTQNTVVWGALLAFWNASQVSEVRSVLSSITRLGMNRTFSL